MIKVSSESYSSTKYIHMYPVVHTNTIYKTKKWERASKFKKCSDTSTIIKSKVQRDFNAKEMLEEKYITPQSIYPWVLTSTTNTAPLATKA